MGNRFTMAERERLEEIKNYIQTHLGDELYLTNLCSMALMNRHRLNDGFKKIHGKNVFAFIREQRMRKAKTLLQQTDMSLREIAETTGYTYTSNFLIAYKRFYGYSACRERME